MRVTLKIEGMMCDHCRKHVEEALAAIDGVSSVEVSLADQKAEVALEYEIEREKFEKVIKEAGYKMIF